MPSKHSAFEVRVSLRYIEPPIWRTLELPGTATLEDVHLATQLAMGWTNSHLHRFEIGGREYGMVDSDLDGLGPDFEDERLFTLERVAKAGASFLYEYDFGDGWEHDVTVQRVSTTSKPVAPRCLDGARACPPEDCGGAPGYERLLEIIANPRHAERDEAMEWLPEGFHPDQCVLPKGSLERAVARLRRAADFEGDDGDEGFDADVPPPAPLVKQALALAPAQRADLVAVLAASLANELGALLRLLTAKSASPRSPSRGKAGKRATAAKPAARKPASKTKGPKRRGR